LSDIQYVYPLIHNKVTSPHYVTPTLRRARLLEWLHGNATCRAIVIAADAGYGKTTLLWQWEREAQFPCYWYKLDRNDRDWSLHISYLIEAISQRHAGFGRRAHSMLQQLGGPGSSRPGVAAYLLAEMYERLTEPCTFIIDDWQFVASVTEVRGLWNQILRDAPPTCRFVFLSRAKPQLQFARFKTHGGYAEMRTDALRFTDREIDELFRDIYNDPLDPTELAELERRTEGWAASLQLVEVSLRERKSAEDRREFIQSITATTDSDLFSFLAEEVLDQQPAEVREFLISTSVLRQINTELAERLTGVHDGARILSDLENRGLFTNRVGSEEARYRYHGLFRDFLLGRLEEERAEGEIAGLHIHAASYYETHEQWPEAIHHYLEAKLQPQAGRLIARYGEDVATEGRLGSIDEWLTKLPPRNVRDNARLSLLAGEAAGMRGEWVDAISALQRSRSFFARKGDRRMESLACLKISTVHSNRGAVELAATVAQQGLVLAPPDAFATRLRLDGNLAITSTWMTGTLDEVVKACRRIAVEAAARGLEHLAAIALHNLGVALRHQGRLEESVSSLRRATAFWAELPASPFADAAELVASLLAMGNVRAAALVADAAVVRTAPWPRPQAEAQYGRALVFAQQGRYRQAREILLRVLAAPDPLGPTAELVASLLAECEFLSDDIPTDVGLPLRELREDSRDPRQAPVVAAARAIARHYAGTCRGECLDEAKPVTEWRRRGATAVASTSLLKIGALAVEHGTSHARRLALEALHEGMRAGVGRSLRHWLRRYTRRTDWFVDDSALDDVLSAAALDPDGWRDALVRLLPNAAAATRLRILEQVGKHATRDTVLALQSIDGTDVAEVRKAISNRQAPRLFVRSFGTLAIHRIGWHGPMTVVDKKRLRALLGYLVAHTRSALTREMVVEALWPDAEPSAAINSLNQAVFQLRRILDGGYRDGDSPQYLISTVDVVQLNPDLVRTDLDEMRRLATHMSDANAAAERREAAVAIVDLARGEFLSELRYEDWLTPLQPPIHAEVRALLLPIASDATLAGPDKAIQAGYAALQMDGYDDAAHYSIASQYLASGQRAAARDALERYERTLRDDLDESLSPALAELLGRLHKPGVPTKVQPDLTDGG